MGGQVDRASTILNRPRYSPGEMVQTVHADGDKGFRINTFQDVEPHLDYAKACRRAERENRVINKRGTFHRTMALPFNVIMGVAQRLGIQNKDIFGSDEMDRIYRELKRPEFKFFRTTEDKRI